MKLTIACVASVLAAFVMVSTAAPPSHREVVRFSFKDFTKPEFTSVGDVDAQSPDTASQTLGDVAPLDLVKFQPKSLPTPLTGKIIVYDIETTKIDKRTETVFLFFKRTKIDRTPQPSSNNQLPKTVSLGNQLRISFVLEPLANPAAAQVLPLTAATTELRVARPAHLRVKMAATNDIAFAERPATAEEIRECQREANRRHPSPQFENTRVKNVRVIPGTVSAVIGEVVVTRFR